MSKGIEQLTEIKVCPVMTCSSIMIFDLPMLPCARHGTIMVNWSEAPLRKRIYRQLKGKLLGYNYVTHKKSAPTKANQEGREK